MTVEKMIENLNAQYATIRDKSFWDVRETLDGNAYLQEATKMVKYSFLHEALTMNLDIRDTLSKVPDAKIGTLLEDLFNFDFEYDEPMWTEWAKVETLLQDYIDSLSAETKSSEADEYVGRIDFFGLNGELDCSHPYTSAYAFERDIKEENYYGVPMGIVVYADKDGNTIPHEFVLQMDPPPKYFRIEKREEN